MTYIPSGTFWMGCNGVKDANCNADENPQHKVTLSAYYMDLTETTVAQYKACVDASVCTAPGSVQPTPYATYPGLTNFPVNFVNWTQSQAYCKWRGSAYDLPTEAQWEMAARGSCEKNGSTAGSAACAQAMRTYPWGEAAATCSYAVINDSTSGCGTGAMWEVGQKPAGDSPYGLHDMAGNAMEWVRDWYPSAAPWYPSAAQIDPSGAGSATFKGRRGGAYTSSTAAFMRAGFRGAVDPLVAVSAVGGRCVRTYLDASP